MKNSIIKIIYLTLISLVLNPLDIYSQDNYDNYISLINEFNGRYSTGSDITDGSMAVSETNFNVIYKYPISNYRIDDANINVSLTYSGQVQFSSFVSYNPSSDTWIKQTQKKPAWIVGVNGFAVDVLKKTGLFSNPSWLNHASYYKDYEFYEDMKKQYVELKGQQEITFHNKDMVWMVDGYDYCTNMKQIESGLGGKHDKIFILKSDGSLMQLMNEQTKQKVGVYSELNSNNKSYAVVKKGYHNNLSSTPKYPGESIDPALSEYDYDRILYYYPGDGYEYVFQEYLTPYGNQYYQPAVSETYDYDEEDNNITTKYFVNYGISGNGKRTGSPTIFYLVRINHQNRELIRLSYDWHIKNKREPSLIDNPSTIKSELRFNDGAVGRASIRHFNHHYFTWINNTYTIRSFNKEFQIDIGHYPEINKNGEEDYHKYFSNFTFYGLYEPFREDTLRSKGTFMNSGWKKYPISDGSIERWYIPSSSIYYMNEITDNNLMNSRQVFYEKRPVSNTYSYLDTYTMARYEIPEYKKYFTVLYYPRKITETSWSSDINNPSILTEKSDSKERKYTYFSYEEYTTKYHVGSMMDKSDINFPSLNCGNMIDKVLSDASQECQFPYSRANTHVSYANTDRRLVQILEPMKIIDIDYQYYQSPYTINGVTPIEYDPVNSVGINYIHSCLSSEMVWKSTTNAVAHYSITDKYSSQKIRSVGYRSPAYMDKTNKEHRTTIADTINILSLDANNNIVVGETNNLSNKYITTTTENIYDYFDYSVPIGLYYMHEDVVLRLNKKNISLRLFDNINKQQEKLKTIETSYKYDDNWDISRSVSENWNSNINEIVTKVTVDGITSSQKVTYDYDYKANPLYAQTTFKKLFKVKDKVVQTIYGDDNQKVKIKKDSYVSLWPAHDDAHPEKNATFDNGLIYLGLSIPSPVEFYENKIYNEWKYLIDFMGFNFSFIVPSGSTVPEVGLNDLNLDDKWEEIPKVKSLDQTLSYKMHQNYNYESCFWSEQKWYESDTTKWLPSYPILELKYKEEVFDGKYQFLTGFESLIQDREYITYNAQVLPSYSRGKPYANYKLFYSDGKIQKFKLDSTVFSFGYQGGGLPFKILNPNGALIANYYKYNHNNITSKSCITNPQFTVEDFFDRSIIDSDLSPCGCDSDEFFTPAGILAANDKTFHLDKIIETRNLTVRSKPVATRQFVRKYVPLDDGDGKIEMSNSADKIELNGVADVFQLMTDEEGHVIEESRDLNPESAFSLDVLYEYSPTGDKIAEMGPNYYLTNYSYDDCNRLSKVNLPKDFVNPFSSAYGNCYSGTYLEIPSMATVVSTIRKYTYQYIIENNIWKKVIVDEGLDAPYSVLGINGNIGIYSQELDQLPKYEINCYEPNKACNSNNITASIIRDPDLIEGISLDDLEEQLENQLNRDIELCTLDLQTEKQNITTSENEIFLKFVKPDMFQRINLINDIFLRFKNFCFWSDDATATNEIPGTFYLTLKLLDVQNYKYVEIDNLDPVIVKVDPSDLVFNPDTETSTLDLNNILFTKAFLDEFLQLINESSNNSAYLSVKILSTSESGLEIRGNASNISLYVSGDFEIASDANLDYVRNNYTMCDYSLRNNYSPYFYAIHHATMTSESKIDDKNNTFNPDFVDGVNNRYKLSRSHFGYDYKLFTAEVLTQAETPVSTTYIAPSMTDVPYVTREKTQSFNNGTPIEIINVFNGDGSVLGVINSNDSEQIYTDRFVNASDITKIYTYLAPYFQEEGLVEYYNSAITKQTSSNNVGIKTETFTNKMGNKILEIIDAGDNNHKNKTTIFKYDDLDRIEMILNLCDNSNHSDDQEILYSYDLLGRVDAKYQPDQGIVSFRYDSVGNVRFSQTQKQHDSSRISYFQYDDLNRITVSGEVELDKAAIEVILDKKIVDYAVEKHKLINSHSRIIDALDPYRLNDGDFSEILTANKTLWYHRDSGIDYPVSPDEILEIKAGYPLILNNISKFYDMDEEATLPLLVHKAPLHDLRFQWGHTNPHNIKKPTEFENILWFPDLVRAVMNYDELPPSMGTVWGEFPKKAIWDEFAKKSYTWRLNSDKTMGRKISTDVKNLKGRKAAIAYRESGALPFNYMVFSYDARGRVEALLRYTDNLGYDAVYYYYNSADQIICQITADPIRHQITWNEYDDYGNLSNVFTTPPIDRGLCKGVNGYEPGNPNFDNLFESGSDDYTAKLKEMKEALSDPDVCYSYEHNGLVQNITYIDTEKGRKIGKTIHYDDYKRETRTEVDVDGNPLYNEVTTYDIDSDNIGMIEKYEVLNACNDLEEQVSEYIYDNLGQLIQVEENIDSKHNYSRRYGYNLMGNRVADTLISSNSDSYAFNYNLAYKKNRLSSSNLDKNFYHYTSGDQNITNSYNNSGELKNEKYQKSGYSSIPGKYAADGKLSAFEYDSRGLLHRYAYKEFTQLSGTPIPAECYIDFTDDARVEWRYAYNPMGDREQKRVFHTPDGDNNWNYYPWTYNMLGTSGNTLAVYHGAQISDPDISYKLIDQAGYDFNLEKIRDKIGVPYKRNGGDADTNQNIVFMYPVEFNPHPGISYRPSKNNQYSAEWSKNIILTDRMGSTKLVLGKNEDEGFRYLPFGKQVPRGEDDQRTAYLGKELDRESELGDHGVRKVDYGLGRFTTCDPLWEKYYAWSPYQYSMNNPISFADWNGKEVIVNMQGDIISNDGKDNRVTLDLGGKNLYLPIGELGGKIDIGIIYPNKISANIEEAENSGLWEFKTKVSNGSKWDLKMNKNTIYGLGNGNTTFLFEGQEMESQDVGNHFFGIMGKATGMFSNKELLMGAGIYQMYSGTSKSEWQKYKPQTVMIMDASGYVSKMTVGVLSAPYGDDPRDQSWIREGIKYFNIHF